jgi:DamX protein
MILSRIAHEVPGVLKVADSDHISVFTLGAVYDGQQARNGRIGRSDRHAVRCFGPTELEFQEAETSLVARIADVDDDRRLTTNRLQRAWQTQREEIETRLGRQASMFAGGLLLLAILLGVALVFTYGQLDAGRRALLEDVAQLRTDHHQLASSAIQGTDLQDELSSLRASVSAISKRLEHAEEQPSATQDAVLQAELSGLRASIAAVSARLERAEEQTNAQASAPPGAENATLPRDLEPETDSLSTDILPDPAAADPAQRVERPDIEPEPSASA